ncbi:MAG: outer membrane beta-barrel protein [Gemmatimonadaceae bacterium]
MRRHNTVAIALVLAGIFADVAHAQSAAKSRTRGFFLGGGLEGAAQSVEDSNTDSGAGAGLTLGYGFNKTWALFVNGSGASLDSDEIGSYTLGQGDVGVRVSFRSGPNQVVPYIVGALSGRTAKIDFIDDQGDSHSADVNGTGLTLGAGLNVFFSPSVALDLHYLYTGGSYDEVKFNNITISGLDAKAQTGRFRIGVNWFVGK